MLGPPINVDITLQCIIHLNIVAHNEIPFLETVFPLSAGKCAVPRRKLFQKCTTTTFKCSPLNPIAFLWDVLDKQIYGGLTTQEESKTGIGRKWRLTFLAEKKTDIKICKLFERPVSSWCKHVNMTTKGKTSKTSQCLKDSSDIAL